MKPIEITTAEDLILKLLKKGSTDIDKLVEEAVKKVPSDETVREALWNLIDRDSVFFTREFELSISPPETGERRRVAA